MKWIWLLLLSVAALGQQITITGTVKDANGNVYANGSGRAVLVPSSTQFLFGNSPVQSTVPILNLTTAGTFSVQLYRTDTLSWNGFSNPPLWQFSFCNNTGSTCFTMTPLALTSPQDITSQIQAQATILPGSGGTAPTVANAPVPSAAYTFYPATSSACSTYSVTGTTFCALNNATGAVDYNGTDMTVVITNAINNVSSRCGTLFFKNGTYNYNSFNTESTGGFTNSYAIGIPGNVSAGQYCMWNLVGEAVTPPIGIGSPGVQTAGVVFNITTTATSSIAATQEYVGIWARPATAGSTVQMSNIDVRRPNNQRGCSTGIDMSNAIGTYFTWVQTDYNTAFGSYLAPVAGSGCSGGVPSAANEETGVTTSASGLQLNTWFQVQAVGSDVCLDFQSEHLDMQNVYANNCNFGIDYGVRGGGIFHTSAWNVIGIQSCIRGLTLGSNMQRGTVLDITGFDIQDASSGAFLPVYHALETNVGFTAGRISYNDTLAGDGILATGSFFDGGGGSNFVLQSIIGNNSAIYNFSIAGPANNTIYPNNFAFDTFTRANASTLGTNWLSTNYSLFTTNCQITSNTAQPTGAGAAACGANYINAVPVNDQFSKGTVSTVDSNAVTFASVTTNNTLAGNAAGTTIRSQYMYYCGGAAAQGSGILEVIAGTVTTLASQTSSAGCANGDTIELRRVGTWLMALRNGTLDPAFAPNPVQDTKLYGGVPGIVMRQDTAGGVAMTNWFGGNLPNTQRLINSDFTDASSASFQPIFSWALPGRVGSFSFHCSILYNQTVAAVSDSFGVQATGTAPVNISANGWSQTAAATVAYGNLPTLNTTTATAVVTFTPSAITTVWAADLEGTIETSAQTLLSIMVSQSTAADLMVIKRGSYCYLTTQ